jgi:nucleoside-diphosphate-sugar epimerase
MFDYTVLGSKGFVGSNLVNYLTQKGYKVYSPNKRDSNYSNIEHGHIIYCIGLTSDFRTRPLETMNAHVCILREILEKTKFRSITYLSSTRIYVKAKSTKEDTTLNFNPENLDDLYGISKIAGESICNHSKRKNVKILRLSNVVGIRKDNDLFIDQLLEEIIKYKTLTLKSPLESAKDYIYINDVVDMIIAVSQSEINGCFNLASGKNTKNQEIINHFSEFLDFKLIINNNQSLLKYKKINIEKLKNNFNFEPRQLNEYFPEYIKSYKKLKGIK